jgi:hypothetical protein
LLGWQFTCFLYGSFTGLETDNLNKSKMEVTIMGGGRYSSRDWDKFSSSRKYSDPKTTTKHIYSRGSMDKDFDPKNFKLRESVDGPDNPESTPIIIGLDVTGSMSPVLDVIARKGLKTVCEEIYNRKPVTNPHICVLGIGDVECDSSPFQATQFEADIRIFEALEKLYLEGGGGGNNHESYILAWYFAHYRTKTDSFSKRGRKGFIFTVGDECITPKISSDAIKRFMGDNQARTVTAQEMFTLVTSEWNVFHIIVKQGSFAGGAFDMVKKSWEDVIGVQRTIPLDDHTKIGEVIVSTLEIAAGKNLADTVASWDGKTAVVVGDALKSMTGAVVPKTKKGVDAYL